MCRFDVLISSSILLGVALTSLMSTTRGDGGGGERWRGIASLGHFAEPPSSVSLATGL